MFRKREHFFAAVILIFAILIAAAILSFPFVLKEIKDEEPLISKIKSFVKTFVKPEQAPPVSEPTVAPDKVEFRVDPEMAVIKDSELLPVDDWKTYRNDKYGFVVKYPKDWYAVPGYDHPDELIYFSTSPTGFKSDFNRGGENWMRISASVGQKAKQETLEDWLKKIAIPAPGIDMAVQYVLRGDKKFLGTFPFKETDFLNAYFQLKDGNILMLMFVHRAPDLYPDSLKIFYTVINYLKY